MKRIIAAVVLVAYALGATAVAQVYQHDPQWPANLDQFAWGVSGEEEASPDGSVSGVDVDLERGIVYVLARAEPNVRVFTVTGELVRAWSPARVERPHMLHVDPAGDLWITDVGLHTATLYSPEGVPRLVLGTPGVPGMDATHFDQPTDVATSENGDVIFVSDGYGNNRIATFDRQGRYLSMWGGAAPGTGKGEFILPHSITRLNDRVYVADRSGGRIQVFDLEGNFIEDWRDFLEPWGVAARDGHVYVVGRQYGRGPLPTMQSLIEYSLTVDDFPPGPVGQDLMVFDGAGKLQAHSVLPQGQTAGAVDWVHGVGVDTTGAVYTADVVGNRAQKWVPVAELTPAE